MKGITIGGDFSLAQRAASGEPNAWDEIIRLYGRRIYNIAFQFAGNGPEAEDLAQEIFLKLFRSLSLYRGDIPLLPWALRLSRNVCIDSYRQSRLQRKATVVSAALLDQLPDSDDPHTNAQRRERLTTVYRALEEMDPDNAMIIVLRDLQGLTYDETAEALGLRLGTMKSRLHRARNELFKRVRKLSAVSGRHQLATTSPAMESSAC